nr:group II intron reverse transcriptase/maturase [Verrucomicrobium sp. 3C]
MQVLSRENMVEAWKRVKANQGSAGVDGLTIEQTVEYLKTQWPRIRQEILDGVYRPQAVRRVEIPKPTGGVRELGIPTVTDRLIQQALLQVLQPRIDPTFSEFSYGFRPGRSAHDAVRQAQRYAQDGYQVVVDVDLEKFFDRVNHDILMDRLAKRIDDKAVLRLIRRYLEAGVMLNGVVVARDDGTPQGGPLSPLLANVLLDDVDRVLTRRGHRFARYADDLCATSAKGRGGLNVCNCLIDEGGPLGTGWQEQVLNHLRRLRPKALVVSTEGKSLGRTRSCDWQEEDRKGTTDDMSKA